MKTEQLVDAMDLRTRDRLARMIGEQGPVTVGTLAEELGLAAAGVRRHLDAMLADGSVDVFDTRPIERRRGRPAKSFVLTDSGHAQLRNTYQDLASSALDFLADQLGPDGVKAFATRRAGDLEQRYLPIVEAAGTDPANRAQALATALSQDGYAASTKPVSVADTTAIQLCQGHCPVYQVANRHPEMCDAEQEAFGRLLGVPVRRLATLAGGAHVCTTHIATTGHIATTNQTTTSQIPTNRQSEGTQR